MATINLNPSTKDTLELDAGSTSWLEVVERNDGRSRPCAVPRKYFDVLVAWGYLTGTVGAARLSPAGRARLAAEKEAARAEKKTARKKK